MWTFLEFVDGEEGVVTQWLRTATPQADAKFRTRIEALEQMRINEWRAPYAKQLVDHDGLVEIRFQANNVQHRFLGFFGPDPQQFSFTFCAREVGDKFVPKSALKTAQSRKGLVHDREGQVRILNLDEEDEEEAGG